MKRIALYCIIFLCTVFHFSSSEAQTSRLYRLKPDEEAKQTIWRDSLYRFKQFMDGRLTYIVGKSQHQKFNYNLFSGKVEFINDLGDTLDVTESNELRLAMISNRVFYFDPRSGYIEILLQLPL